MAVSALGVLSSGYFLHIRTANDTRMSVARVAVTIKKRPGIRSDAGPTH